MAAPGIEVRPIIEMTGGNHFNEMFLTDVRIPADHRIGAEGDGWRLAAVTLGNERVSLSEGGVLWGMGPDDRRPVRPRSARPAASPIPCCASGPRVHTGAEVLDLLGRRMLTAVLQRPRPGPRGVDAQDPRRRARPAGHGAGQGPAGRGGMLGVQGPDAEEVDVWHWGYLFSRALTIGGGTSEVQRNIIGERLLGPAPGAAADPR